MTQHHHNVKQRKNQSIKKYVNYLNKLEAQMKLFTDTQHHDHFMTNLKSEIASTIAECADQLTTYHSTIKLTSHIKKSWEIQIKLNHFTNLITDSANRKTEK